MRPEPGDVIIVEGKEYVIESVDDHNNKIYFENGLLIHGAALHSDLVEYPG